MAKLITHNKGFKIIEMNPHEAITQCGFGYTNEIICDTCNKGNFIDDDVKVYYIAVLNLLFCEDCYKEWAETATYYIEDEKYEINYFNYYKQLLSECIIPTGD